MILVENTFTRHLVEDARGAMTLVIAPDQFASTINFFLFEPSGNILLTNISAPWTDLNSPGVREYSYNFHPETIGCYSFYISDNLNKGYGEGYFKLLAGDGSILMYNDGKNCDDLYSFFNVTEPYVVSVNDLAKETISIFPNPAQSQFIVTNAENATIQLYNILGQKVKQVTAKEENTIIQTEDLSAGMYVKEMLLLQEKCR